MTDNYDQLALSWVRKEINNTLDQARQGLENFAEDNQDQTQIQFCINCLHQVQGTLQMLEFSGAAKLASEMEILAEKMASDNTFAVEAAFEVLMRALLQMPGYLERVEEGQKDIPVILLPLINELRAAGNQTPISERELFSADTQGVLPPKAVEKVTEKDKTTAFQDNAKKLRAHFQKGLTGVIRLEKIKESLARIHKVLLRLEALTEGHPVSRLWWVADGFIFSITEGGLYKRKEVHLLLSQVDKQIKRLSDQGKSALDDVIPEKLLSQLLYFVARSKSKNARINALKEEFNLESVLADSEQIKKRQARLAKPDSTAVSNVAGAINEELATVKDQLDLFVRAQAKDPSQLQNLVDSLVRISDTLTLLELAIPRDVIRQQVKQIQKLIDLGKMPDDSTVMDIAGALLFVEANLKNINLEASSQTSDEVESSELSQTQAKESQVDDATEALIKVARKSMQAAKDKMINYIASGFEREALADVPNLLEEVLGGVRIVQFDNAARILKIAKDFVEQRIIAVEVQPKEERLDALADVITSVEYFLEASEEGKHRGVNSILKGAQKSVESLESALSEAAPQAEIVSVPVPEKAQVEEHQMEEVPEPVKTEKADVIPLVSSAEKQVDETLIDEEVLEIFLEEAEEEIQTINDMLPRWTNSLQDDEALTTLRRSFHTLKGSGRLVGAKVIGEVSWAVEDMLNKVIEESIPAETQVITVLNESQAMMPQLVDAFAHQKPIECNYQQLVAKAEHIAKGKQLADFDFAEPEGEVEEKAADVAASQPEAIDPVLLEIFSTEAQSHLETIADYLSGAPREGSVAVTDDMIRALHTLKGSANMAGVGTIAKLTGPWEKYSRLIKGSGHRFEQNVIALLQDTHDYLKQSLDNLTNSLPLDNDQLTEILDNISQLKTDYATATGSSVKQRDQQFVSIFLTEGLDILHEVSKLNDSLEKDFSNAELKESIRFELHTFHRGAELVAIDELEQLASASEKLATFAANRDSISESYNLLLVETIEKLTAMLNKIASEEDIESPQNIVAKIDEWIEGSGTESVPEDMDVELVELFVEEGEELIEAARDLLSRWKDNLNNKDIIVELRRIFHTLKGSSRMAGAMNVGELGYAAEDLFNTVVDFGRELSPVDYDITIATTDKLEAMIAELKTLRWPGDASQDVKIIRDHLSPETEVAEVVVEPEVETEPEVEAELEVEPQAEVETEAEIDFELEVPTIVDEVSDADEFVLDSEVEQNEIVANEVETEHDAEILVEEELLETELPASESVEELSEISLDSEPAAEEAEITDESLTFDSELIEADEETFEVESSGDDAELIPTLEDVAEQEISEQEVTEEELEEPEVEIEAVEAVEAEEIETLEEATSLEASDFDSSEFDDSEYSELEEIETVQDEPLEAPVSEEELEIIEPVATETEALQTEDVELESETAELEALEAGEAEQEEIAQEEAEQESIVSEDAELEELISEDETVEQVDTWEEEEEAHAFAGENVVDIKPDEPTTSETFVEDTISPAAPIVVTGNIHKVDLDEDGEEVLEIYLEEADELLVTLDEALHEWSESLDNKNAIDLLQRTLHTMKGGARLSDLIILGDLTHEMETYFERVNSGQLTARDEDVDFMLQGYDVIAALVKEVETKRQMTVPETYMKSLEALIKGESPVLEPVAEVPVEEVEEPEEAAEADQVVAEVVSFEKKKQQQAESKAKVQQSTEVIRVPSEQLEGLVNLAGETSIFRSRLEQQMSVLKYNLEEMSATIERLRDQLRNLDIETEAQILYRREISGGAEYEDFDPLEMDRYTRQQELTRGLGESAVDLMSLKESLDSLTSDSETLLLQQGRVNTEMQESLMRTRMIPFESLVPRLRRMIRQISTELGKTIELSISAEGEMDRNVLERMIAPIEHMLRNAMDHGIESPDERRANQKPEKGSIKISLFREGSEVFIKIQDDGRGLNLKAIRQKAQEKGLISESSDLSDHELQQLILEAGFSTAEKVTQISGRGVGMDVVSSEIKQMGGVIEIDSTQGVGSIFTVKLPFTVSVNHALMVQLGEEVFAIPLANIEGIVRVSPFELEEYYSNEDVSFEYAGIDYSMYYLGQLLDHNRSANLQGVTQPLPVLLLHGADHPTALQVDDLLGSREIVVKSLGSQLSLISGLSGATILGDGRVVLILDMPALIRRIDATVALDREEVVQVEDDRAPVVMVVDDSITVRKVTTRLLERHDFEVITAKDGVDALTVLGDQKPDVMLLDIEMPRMDGFELATIIRHDDALKDLPIIMITSRTGEKHRERAEQIGVNQYMGKPYNEVDLLDSISALLPTRT
ncbi:Hpt domain-containing protein [Aliikangiella coralliicola]|uniref:Chemotaxis protein CheA n=1 Tax=Aliikangiella coralliicola TaxID=2592383 RepID=A0A545UHT0_9GAMM|nr:Hpt domain-containing protein [Aliikangiella coralliicola]TQV89025.1 response regulator [Aliikangiella coralliicola]